MLNQIDTAIAALDRVRCEQPLVHLITNFVTMNEVANAVLAIGAHPVMAHAPEEVAEVTRGARALVLNLGTPSRDRVVAMRCAGQAANERGIPIVFDPVGVGVSAYRQACAAEMLASLCLAIVRGNAGEIGKLAGISGTQLGVDTVHAEYDRPAIARGLAKKIQMVIVVTGSTDYVSDGVRIIAVENGHPALAQIAGAGDMLDALIATSAA